MRCTRGLAVLLSACVLSWGGNALAQEGKFQLELNSLKMSENKCRATFLATNQLGTPLDKTVIKIGVIDQSGEAELMRFEFGKFTLNKKKIVIFDLDRPCDQISELIFNEFSECAGPAGPVKDCEENTAVTSRIKTPFSH
jgi:hypothetical protein